MKKFQSKVHKKMKVMMKFKKDYHSREKPKISSQPNLTNHKLL